MLNRTALTIKGQGLLNVLITGVEVFFPGQPGAASVQAIWDTGATGSVITKNVTQMLGLLPTGFCQVHTAGGIVTQNTYIVNLGLPNGVLVQSLEVTEADALSSGCDVLIGMNIINLGDFSVTNFNGKTCMSFRFPSCHEIDYVEKTNMGVKANIPPGQQGSNITPKKKKRK